VISIWIHFDRNHKHPFKKPLKEPLFVGTLVHPNGNISELLLKEGFAKCVDWSLGMMTG